MQILLAMKKTEQHGALLYSLTFAQQDDSFLISRWHNIPLLKFMGGIPCCKYGIENLIIDPTLNL
jgi:hypothetical protein